MKKNLIICFIAISILLGIANFYILPILVMFGLNKAKGSGNNPEGEMFQIPALVVMAIFILCTIAIEFLMYRKLKDCIIRFILILSFALGGVAVLCLSGL